jgi:crotonobetainyl-CoA:carnitine CoA-transferase CaiB-like acyl-CoA transferase
VSSPRRGPLAGIRVIDLSHQAAGPWCTSLLGDMGADVLKVEKPGRGDGIRHAGRRPPELGSLNFVGLNRNKRGITIDIGQEAGCALVRRLAAKADVVVENFRPGVMERHGIGWEQLRALNPRLVYCSITAFGPRGPLAQKPGMDLIIQATAGLMGHTGEEGGPPMKSAPPVADITTGIYAAYGIMGALLERDRPGGSGAGQKVEVAMLDAVISMFSDIAANVLTDGTKYGKFGTGHPDLVPYQAFPAKDGWFVVACLTNAFYNRLCDALARPDLLQDPRFVTNRERLKHRAEIVSVLSDIFRTRPRDEWIALLESHDIPACRVNTIGDILAHPQVAENDVIVKRTDQRGAQLSTIGPPVKLSGSPTRFERLAPALGEHTDEALREFGLTDAELAELRAARVI